jgi:hypothetical protein
VEFSETPFLSLAAPTLPHEQMRCVYVPSRVYDTRFLLLQTVDESAPLDDATRTENSRRYWLSGNTTATTVKDFDSKHFLIPRIQHRLGTQFSIINCN